MKKTLIEIYVVMMLLLITFPVITSDPAMDTTSSFESEFEINKISGGFGRINAEISNIGDEDANNIVWEIAVNGGLLGAINSKTNGEIFTIFKETSEQIKSDPIIGFGEIDIKIKANDIEKSAKGYVFFFYIIIISESELQLELEPIASGFSSPVVLTHGGDGSNRLFIVDQIGKIYVLDQGELLSEPFLDLTDKIVELDTTYDERGLLGLTFHPDYETNKRFFVYYSSPKTGPGINHESILSEFIVSDNPNVADEESEKIILRVDQPEANHNGGQLVFGPDGYLYIGLGDGGGAGDVHGEIGNGQDINTLLGSIIRIDVDSESPYSIPADNPFVGKEGLDEIYSWGFRNPWKFSFDKETQRLFVADVGQDEWEEIDIVEKGRNYGWRILEATHFYDEELAETLEIDVESLADPIHEYNHDLGRSITGGFLYRGIESPKLLGKYIFGDWSSSFILPRGQIFYLDETEPGVWERFKLNPTQTFNRFILSFGEDENGEIYVLSKTTLGPDPNVKNGDVKKIIVK